MTERSPKRRHPAKASRIATAGFGVATMFGLIGAFGYTRHTPAGSNPAPPAAPLESQVVVVVHHDGPSGSSAGTTLHARPSVRPATAAPRAPKASTGGSR
jgi:hypothetical protein